MKKRLSTTSWKKYIGRRQRDEARRRDRPRRIKDRFQRPPTLRQPKDFSNYTAPKKFSFINNTHEVLKYFDEAERLFRRKIRLNLDISEIDELTPDAISLLVAKVNDPHFHHGSGYIGGAPRNPELQKLFTQSGFYDFVQSTVSNKKAQGGNLLHRERHYKVVPQIAQRAALTGMRHTFGNDVPYEPLYDVLIECMSNTNNHASSKVSKKCNWWLYVYSDPSTKISSYSFLDLGVGIFESMIVRNYIRNIMKGNLLWKNITFVDDLLSGKIQSRIEEDREIRGKGIPQIVEYSRLDTFKKFVIITNDVKIDLKTFEREQLDCDFKGTFLYWEIQPI